MNFHNMVGLCLLAAFLALSSCSLVLNYQDNTAMVALVKHGQTAAQARCAVKDASTSFCSIIAAKEAESGN